MQKCQQSIEKALHRFFYWWGHVVGSHPAKVALGSLIVLIAWAGGWAINAEFADEQRVWTPKNGEAIKDLERIDELFPATQRIFKIYATASDGSSNVLTKAAFEDLNSMDSVIRSFSTTYNGKTYSFANLCVKTSGTQCKVYTHPLQFYEQTDGTFDLSTLTSDSTLVT